MGLFRRGDLAEPPPKEYRGRGLAPGFKLVELDSLEAVNKFCRDRGVTNGMAHAAMEACVLDGDRLVVMPKQGSRAMDEARYRALLEHESGHTWGLTHDNNGRGWVRNPDFFRKNGHIVDEALVGKAPPLKTRMFGAK